MRSISAPPAVAPSRATRRGGRERGYVLLVFAIFSAILVIGAYRLLPKYVFEGQRIKEEELIFRGKQYQRAIQLFVRRFGRYPGTLEELEDTNQLRFIRKLYPDPMTEDGEWRLVHIGPDGVFYDSVHLTTPPGSRGGDSSPERQTDPFQLTARQPGGAPEEEEARQASSSPNPAQQPRASGVPQTGRVFGGGGIAGVASKHEGESIKVLNNYRHYNEWEFVYDYRTDPLGVAAVNRVSGGAPQAPAGQPGTRPGSQAPPGQQPIGIDPLTGRPILPGQQPLGRNPITGQPMGIPVPGQPPGAPPPGQAPPGFSGTPFPGGLGQPNQTPQWNIGPPPTEDPFRRR